MQPPTLYTLLQVEELNASRLAEAESMHEALCEAVREANRAHKAEHAELQRQRKEVEATNLSRLVRGRRGEGEGRRERGGVITSANTKPKKGEGRENGRGGASKREGRGVHGKREDRHGEERISANWCVREYGRKRSRQGGKRGSMNRGRASERAGRRNPRSTLALPPPCRPRPRPRTRYGWRLGPPTTSEP